MQIIAILLFDIDGVIRNVANSYRLAVQETVNIFCGWRPTNLDIDEMKSEGIWNNDWDLTLELINRRINKKNLTISPPLLEEVVKSFEGFYFGGDPNGDSNNWSGFIQNEDLLVDMNLFKDLNDKRVAWGFVSGAELPSARFVLERKLGLKDPPLISMGDAPEKPDPSGFISLARKIAPQPLGSFSPPVVYIGDTIADVKTVINARIAIPEQRFISLAVAPPHLHEESLREDRLKYEAKLKAAGADLVLKSTNDVKDLSFDTLLKSSS